MAEKNVLKMITMRLEGATFTEIGKEFGITKQGAEFKIKHALRITRGVKSGDESNPLIRYRLKYSLTQLDMAKRMEMTQPAYSYLERQANFAHEKTMNKIVQATLSGISHFDLLAFKYSKKGIDLISQARKTLMKLDQGETE